ncbi:hypothetical protein SeMB42_g02408 [Synchytrium endobioticum]|uniref:Response regulatory domain-containing protein n=1 Tax=Synchytrium endobioticum TaxID=286115 RepID=A0A507DGS2_9FUNG|nr:hypothetical protein SeMB42_g02408 [Synchytrium endobioticum]
MQPPLPGNNSMPNLSGMLPSLSDPNRYQSKSTPSRLHSNPDPDTPSSSASLGDVHTSHGCGGMSGSTAVKTPSQDILDQLATIQMPDFVRKLFRMLEEPDDSNTVAWISTGDGFVVKDPTEFARLVLPRHFKHNNFASFVRQLNKYGFHKVKLSEESKRFGEQAWEFQHEHFHREKRYMLELIKRKASAPRINRSSLLTIVRRGEAAGPAKIDQEAPSYRSEVDTRNLPPPNGHLLPRPPTQLNAIGTQAGVMQPCGDPSPSNYIQHQHGLPSQPPMRPMLPHQTLPIIAPPSHILNNQPLPPVQHLPPVLQPPVNQRQPTSPGPSQASPSTPGGNINTAPVNHSGIILNGRPPRQQSPILSPQSFGAMMNNMPKDDVFTPEASTHAIRATHQQINRCLQLQNEMATHMQQMSRTCHGCAEEVMILRQTVNQQDHKMQDLRRDVQMLRVALEMQTQEFHQFRAKISMSGNKPAPTPALTATASTQVTPVMPLKQGLLSSTSMNIQQQGQIDSMMGIGQDSPSSPQQRQQELHAYSNINNGSNFWPENSKHETSSSPSSCSRRRDNGPDQGGYPSYVPIGINDDCDSIPTVRSPSPTTSEIMKEFIMSPATVGRAEDSDDDEDGQGNALARVLAHRKKKWSVLLVEDDYIMRELYSKQLSMAGYTFDVAEDGVAAVEIVTSANLKKRRYDIVLMDIIMPKLDGVSATTRIRQFDQYTPIISMTSSTTDNDCIRYFSSGMNDILPKPFTREMLSSMIDKWANAYERSFNLLMQPSGGDLDGRIEELDEDGMKKTDGKSFGQSNDERFTGGDLAAFSASAGGNASNSGSTFLNNKLQQQGLDNGTHRNIIILPRNRHASDSSASSNGSSGSPAALYNTAFISAKTSSGNSNEPNCTNADGWNSFSGVLTPPSPPPATICSNSPAERRKTKSRSNAENTTMDNKNGCRPAPIPDQGTTMSLDWSDPNSDMSMREPANKRKYSRFDMNTNAKEIQQQSVQPHKRTRAE